MNFQNVFYDLFGRISSDMQDTRNQTLTSAIKMRKWQNLG